MEKRLTKELEKNTLNQKILNSLVSYERDIAAKIIEIQNFAKTGEYLDKTNVDWYELDKFAQKHRVLNLALIKSEFVPIWIKKQIAERMTSDEIKCVFSAENVDEELILYAYDKIKEDESVCDIYDYFTQYKTTNLAKTTLCDKMHMVDLKDYYYFPFQNVNYNVIMEKIIENMFENEKNRFFKDGKIDTSFIQAIVGNEKNPEDLRNEWFEEYLLTPCYLENYTPHIKKLCFEIIYETIKDGKNKEDACVFLTNYINRVGLSAWEEESLLIEHKKGNIELPKNVLLAIEKQTKNSNTLILLEEIGIPIKNYKYVVEYLGKKIVKKETNEKKQKELIFDISKETIMPHTISFYSEYVKKQDFFFNLGLVANVNETKKKGYDFSTAIYYIKNTEDLIHMTYIDNLKHTLRDNGINNQLLQSILRYLVQNDDNDRKVEKDEFTKNQICNKLIKGTAPYEKQFINIDEYRTIMEEIENAKSFFPTKKEVLEKLEKETTMRYEKSKLFNTFYDVFSFNYHMKNEKTGEIYIRIFADAEKLSEKAHKIAEYVKTEKNKEILEQLDEIIIETLQNISFYDMDKKYAYFYYIEELYNVLQERKEDLEREEKLGVAKESEKENEENAR